VGRSTPGNGGSGGAASIGPTISHAGPNGRGGTGGIGATGASGGATYSVIGYAGVGPGGGGSGGTGSANGLPGGFALHTAPLRRLTCPVCQHRSIRSRPRCENRGPRVLNLLSQYARTVISKRSSRRFASGCLALIRTQQTEHRR
jgi:hypothetical protein